MLETNKMTKYHKSRKIKWYI